MEPLAPEPCAQVRVLPRAQEHFGDFPGESTCGPVPG